MAILINVEFDEFIRETETNDYILKFGGIRVAIPTRYEIYKGDRIICLPLSVIEREGISAWILE